MAIAKAICNFCGTERIAVSQEPCLSTLSTTHEHYWIIPTEKREQATRTPLSTRYDLLVPSFLRAMAQVGKHGADKFGENNYQLNRMVGKDGPPNHIMNHLGSYMLYEKYNHSEIGEARKYHLAAIAFNAMMEWWYEEHKSENTDNPRND